MKKTNSRISVLVVAAMVAAGWLHSTTNHVHGQVVNLLIQGTYNTLGTTIFGQNGPAIPYSYSMEYDTSLDTNTFEFGVGATLNSRITTHEWHGYSSSGIVNSDFTFGTNTFETSAIQSQLVQTGVSADFWLDVDLASAATPSLLLMDFNDFTFPAIGALELSAIETNVTNIYINSYARIFDYNTGGASDRDFTLAFSASPVPEPSGMFLLALAALASFRRRR